MDHPQWIEQRLRASHGRGSPESDEALIVRLSANKRGLWRALVTRRPTGMSAGGFAMVGGPFALRAPDFGDLERRLYSVLDYSQRGLARAGLRIAANRRAAPVVLEWLEAMTAEAAPPARTTGTARANLPSVAVMDASLANASAE
jgi:hypothetical protein